MLEGTTLTMEPEVAKRHYLDYRRMKTHQRTFEDEAIMASYRELAKGRSIINAKDALEATGLGPDGYPLIAFGRADWTDAHISISNDGNAIFSEERWRSGNQWSSKGGSLLEAKAGALVAMNGYRKTMKTVVPTIPPAHRPETPLKGFWICWEVDQWVEPDIRAVAPGDPLLLKRLNAQVFSVLAAWDLTDVERMVLNGR